MRTVTSPRSASFGNTTCAPSSLSTVPPAAPMVATPGAAGGSSLPPPHPASQAARQITLPQHSMRRPKVTSLVLFMSAPQSRPPATCIGFYRRGRYTGVTRVWASLQVEVANPKRRHAAGPTLRRQGSPWFLFSLCAPMRELDPNRTTLWGCKKTPHRTHGALHSRRREGACRQARRAVGGLTPELHRFSASCAGKQSLGGDLAAAHRVRRRPCGAGVGQGAGRLGARCTGTFSRGAGGRVEVEEGGRERSFGAECGFPSPV